MHKYIYVHKYLSLSLFPYPAPGILGNREHGKANEDVFTIQANN